MTTETTINIDAVIESLGLRYEAEFVPFSKSRSAKEKQPNLNWKIRLGRVGREYWGLETDYMQGIAHAPDYIGCGGESRKMYGDKYFRHVAETGKYNFNKRLFSGLNHDLVGKTDWYEKFTDSFPNMKPLPAPSLKDVLYCLVMDASVLDSGGFENWASDLGYDTDSRKAEEIFKSCVDIALKLIALIGGEKLRELQIAFQDY